MPVRHGRMASRPTTWSLARPVRERDRETERECVFVMIDKKDDGGAAIHDDGGGYLERTKCALCLCSRLS